MVHLAGNYHKIEMKLPWFCFSGCSHTCTHQNKCACGSWGLPFREWDWRRGGGPRARRERCVYRWSSHLRTRWSGARTETSRWRSVPAAPARTGWCSRCDAWFSSAGSGQGPASCISQWRTCLQTLSTKPLDKTTSDQWRFSTMLNKRYEAPQPITAQRNDKRTVEQWDAPSCNKVTRTRWVPKLQFLFV